MRAPRKALFIALILLMAFLQFPLAIADYIDPAEAPPWNCVAEKDGDNPIFNSTYSAISSIDVAQLDGTFYALYVDQDVPGDWALYIANSTNLKDWTIENDGDPILSPEGTGWEENRNAYASFLTDINGNIIQHEGVYWIIYVGVGDDNAFRFGRANATTLTGPWTKDENNPLDLFSGNNRYSAPVLFKEGETFYMYYSYKAGTGPGNLYTHLANSTDLETWVNSDNNPLISPTSGWQANRIIPEDIAKMVVGETTYYYLLTHGSDAVSYWAGIKRATELDSNSWIDEGNNPLLSPVAATWEADLIDHGTLVAYNGRWNILYTGVVLGISGKMGIAYLREEPLVMYTPTELFGAGFNGSSPYVSLYWTSNMTGISLFEVQNATNKVSWAYLGQNTTTEYHDFQVVNGTQRYYRVRACNYTGSEWVNSTWSDTNFETVYFISEVGEVSCKISSFNATSIAMIAGTLNAGNLASTFSVDGDWYNVSEINDTPGLDVRFNFTNIGGDPNCGCLDVYHSYTGHPQHDIQIQVWNFTSISWYQIGTLIYNETAGWECSGLGNYAEHFFHNGSFWGRFYHEDQGHVVHEMQIDQIRLDVIYGEEVPPAVSIQAGLNLLAICVIFMIIVVVYAVKGKRRR